MPLGAGLIAPLQEFTARIAVGLLDILGVPARLDGLLIRIPGATFHVAEACAGLRFPGLARRGPAARLAVPAQLVAAPPVHGALDRSADRRQRLRAGVVLAAHRVDPSSAVSVDHLTYGYVFTGLLLACLVGLAAMLGAPRRAALWFATRPMPIATDGSGGRIALTATAALVMTALPALAARPAEHCPVVPILSSPQIVAPWRAVSPAADWRPVAANPDAELWHAYRAIAARSTCTSATTAPSGQAPRWSMRRTD